MSSMQRLEHLLTTVPKLLEQISEDDYLLKPAPGKWSKKEILGHLIDSAVHNHQRFVRVQFEETPTIVYRQDAWVETSRYQEMPVGHLISFWTLYNRHLLEILQRIPEAAMQRGCYNGGPEPVSLAFILNDYIAHMEHHLRQIVVL